MKTYDTIRSEMFRKSVNFCENNSADFAENNNVAMHIANLARVIKGLDEATASQQGVSVAIKDGLLDALRTDIQNVARTASAIAQDEPGFNEKLRAPGSFSQKSLLTSANRFLTELNKPGVAEKMIAHELPREFVQHLADSRDRVVKAMDEFQTDRVAGIASTAAIARLVAEGMKEMHYLDAIMRNKYRANSDKLRAWDSVSHIERRSRKDKSEKDAPPKPDDIHSQMQPS